MKKPPQKNNDLINNEKVTQANKLYFTNREDNYRQLKSARKRFLDIRSVLQHEIERDTLLDIGCGYGELLKLSTDSFTTRLGLDISISQLTIAKQYSNALVNGDGSALPFKDDTLSVVTCLGVLHHIFDLEVFIKEIYRVLQKGGVFYSDHDPNKKYIDLTNESTLIAILKKMKSWIIPCCRSMTTSGRRGENDPNGGQDVKDLVEYHWSKGGGIDTANLIKILETVGFRKVNLICHSDSSSLKYPKKGPISVKIKELLIKVLCLEFKYDNVCRIFSVIAIK